jgi:hypothetical protein
MRWWLPSSTAGNTIYLPTPPQGTRWPGYPGTPARGPAGHSRYGRTMRVRIFSFMAMGDGVYRTHDSGPPHVRVWADAGLGSGMWTLGVVFLPERTGDHLRLQHAADRLPTDAFVPEAPIEALVQAVWPWIPGSMKRSGCRPAPAIPAVHGPRTHPRCRTGGAAAPNGPRSPLAAPGSPPRPPVIDWRRYRCSNGCPRR